MHTTKQHYYGSVRLMPVCEHSTTGNALDTQAACQDAENQKDVVSNQMTLVLEAWRQIQHRKEKSLQSAIFKKQHYVVLQ